MRNLFDVAGKVVLISGGSRGIGAMIARGYVENGAKVYVSSRKREACDQTAAELSAAGTCISVPFDLSNRAGIEGLAGAVESRESRLDVLINNAGAAWGEPLDTYSEAGWDKVMSLNLKSVFFLTQRLLPRLRAAASRDAPARIINIASINGLTPPDLETYAYSASKAGLMMLTRHLAKRLAPESILVNAIAPGPFATQMMAATLDASGDEVLGRNPLARFGEARDIAGTAIFLGSRASAYMTGAVIPCDGGAAEL